MQFTHWSEGLAGTGLVFGNKLESQRAGNHTALYFSVRRGSKPIRVYTPLMKCKFVPSDEYNSVDVSLYAPGSGNQEQVDDFVARIKENEEAVIQWAITNADTVFDDFDPVPDEAAIRARFRSCIVDRIESIKFRLVPEHGCAYFDKNGSSMTKEEAREQFASPNLPNLRIGGEIKSVGVYNPSKRKGAKVAFDGKIEMRLFALQVRLMPADASDGTIIDNDICMMPSEEEMA